MKLQYVFDKKIDLISVDSALKSINLPGLMGVRFSSKLNDDGSASHTLDVLFPDNTSLSDAEIKAINAIVESHKNTNNWVDVRMQRGHLFFDVDWRIQRALDEGEDATPLIEYRRALRDITKQESPDTAVWPTKPW